MSSIAESIAEESWIGESIKESISMSTSGRASRSGGGSRRNKFSSSRIQSTIIEEQSFIAEEAPNKVLESEIKSSINPYSSYRHSNDSSTSRRGKRSLKSSIATESDASLSERDLRDRFIDKKFNKLRKDLQYGPLEDIHKRIRKEHIKLAVDKVKEHRHGEAKKYCNFCTQTLLKDLRYPMEKVNRLFMADFLDMQYNRPQCLVDEDPEEMRRKEYSEALRDYATEIEVHEVINRKVMALRCQLVYGPESGGAVEPLDFNYYEA